MITSLKKTSRARLLLAITLLAAVAVYFKFLFFGHISWDDPEMVFKNRPVKFFDLQALLSNHFVGNYIPVTMLVHAVDWLLFGSKDWGHHLINILFHLLNGILVYQLGKRLLKKQTVAITGAIIFLLHPMQIESVGWISELKTILSGTFYLAALLFYLLFNSSRDKKYYILTLIFFVSGCLSKSSVVVLPLSLLCLDVFLQKRISFTFLVNKIPFFLLSVLFGIINIKTQSADLFINYGHAFPYYQRVGYAGYALAKYLLLFLLPVNLSIIYPYPQNVTAAIVTGYFVILAIALVLFFLIWRKKFNYAALILFTLVNFLLVLQFIPFGEVLYADRYMYMPILGFAWIIGLLIAKLRLWPVIPAAVLICALGIASYMRSNTWRSGISLYENILTSFPNSFVALNSVGVEYMLNGNNEKAFYYLTKSTQVAPYNYKGFYNRGLFYLKNQKPEEAVKSFDQSLSIYDYPKAYVGRASAYHMLKEIPKAMADAKHALNIEKNNAKAHFVLGNCYNDMNQLDEALDEYNASISLNSDEPDFYFKRAIVYGKKQNFDACISDINNCLAMDPAHYEAYYWRGVAKANLKQSPCEDFKIAAQKEYQPAIDAFNKYCR